MYVYSRTCVELIQLRHKISILKYSLRIPLAQDQIKADTFHIMLLPLGKILIQLFSRQPWLNSRTD